MARSARVTADRIGALLMQGNALASQGQYRDAIRCYEKILELAPRNLDAIFALHFEPDATAEELQAERTAWGSRYDDLLNGVAHANKPEPDRRLRIATIRGRRLFGYKR